MSNRLLSKLSDYDDLLKLVRTPELGLISE